MATMGPMMEPSATVVIIVVVVNYSRCIVMLIVIVVVVVIQWLNVSCMTLNVSVCIVYCPQSVDGYDYYEKMRLKYLLLTQV